MLRGEEEYDESNEENSAFEYNTSLGKPKEVKYNSLLPIEYFDFIVGLSDTHANSKEQAAIDFINKENIDVKFTLFIGDSIHDYEVANAINVDCVLVSTGHTSKERLLTTKCKVVDNLKQIIL